MSDIDALITQINKQLQVRGAGLRQRDPHLPAGHHRLALASTWRSVVAGRSTAWNEIVGQESNGKTVMALKTIAANQDDNPDYRALWVASEDFNKEWAETLGVDLTRVVLAQTNVMEEAYDDHHRRPRQPDVRRRRARLLPRSDAHRRGRGRHGRLAVGLGARLTNKLMRKSPPAQRRKADERNCLCPDHQPVA